MNDYQCEQWEAQDLAVRAIACLSRIERADLNRRIRPYLEYRQQLEGFLATRFGRHCTQNCFEDGLSACCSKDGIISFWADIVINAIVSDPAQLQDLALALNKPVYHNKCTYLGRSGCCWQLKPLVCSLFLCDSVKYQVFTADCEAQKQWMQLNERAKDFRWPDKPVLFDWLECFFMERRVHSPLMYINKSPGLMRIKHKAGWEPQSAKPDLRP